MQHVISPAEVSNFVVTGNRTNSNTKNAEVNIFSRFMTWCQSQEESRMLWLVMTYLLQIGMALPCTLTAIFLWGNNSFILWVFACVVNVPVLAISLAAQPTKITIPTLLSAWTIDAMIIIYCAGLYFLHF